MHNTIPLNTSFTAPRYATTLRTLQQPLITPCRRMRHAAELRRRRLLAATAAEYTPLMRQHC
jgi:hypothetical protein